MSDNVKKFYDFIRPVLIKITPRYGNYGAPGFGNCKVEDTTCVLPIDWMDSEFQLHDQKIDTNKKLGARLLKGNPLKLAAVQEKRNIFKMGYAIGYQYGAGLLFTVIGAIYDYPRKDDPRTPEKEGE